MKVLAAAKILFASALLIMSHFPINAQTTAFNYQGSLTDGGNPANGSFQMQFKLFDSLSGGAQVGSTISDVPVTVTTGTFSLRLDFGSGALSGANRWIEISIRHNSGESYTTLSPREQIASSPYSVRTLSTSTADAISSACVSCIQDSHINSVAGTKITGTVANATTATNAQNLGGIAANQFVQTTDARLSDARNPLPNSPNYIQNSAAQQAGSNFNVVGNGTVGTLNTNGSVSMAGVAAPAVAPAGQGRLYFDSATDKFRISESGGAFINLVGSGGVSGNGTTNTLPLWSAGTSLGNSAIAQLGTNVGIGTSTPAHKLAAVGGPCWTTDCWGGALELDNASAIGWRQNSSGVKFGIGRTENGLFFFRTNSGLGTTASAPTYDLKMDNFGDIGIGSVGISTDISAAKLNLVTSGYGLEHTDGSVRLASYISPGVGWLGTRSNHPMYFFTNNAAQPQVALLTNGYVGMGTSSPVSRLTVSDIGYGITQTNNVVTVGTYISNTGQIAGWYGTQSNHPLNFFTNNGIARMTIGINGYVGIGNTNPTYALDVRTTGAAVGVYGQNDLPSSSAVGVAGVGYNGVFGNGILIGVDSFSNSGIGVRGYSASGDLFSGFNGSTVFRVTNSGLVCAANVSCASDERLKRDVRPLSLGLNAVLKLRPVRWQWRDASTNQLSLGLIAQEVAPILPDLVLHDKDPKAPLGLNYLGLVPVLVKSIQEQEEQIAAQQRQNAIQQKQIDELLTTNAALNRRLRAVEKRRSRRGREVLRGQ
jgi:hypothetical protein